MTSPAPSGNGQPKVWQVRIDKPVAERLAGMESAAAVYLALGVHADKQGICHPGMKRLGCLTGFSKRWIEESLNRLETGGLIQRQRLSGGRTTYYLGGAAECATPIVGAHPSAPGSAPGCAGGRTGVHRGSAPGCAQERNTIEGDIKKDTPKEEDSSIGECSPMEPPVALDKVPDDGFLIFPCCGRDGPMWMLTQGKVAEYRQSFPGVDVEAECRKALQWCRDNTTRRKTVRGMPAFLSRWLSKEQDRGSPRAAGITRDPDAPCPGARHYGIDRPRRADGRVHE